MMVTILSPPPPSSPSFSSSSSSFKDKSNNFSPFNPLQNDKILDVTKLKAFADDKLNIVKMMISPIIE